MKETKNQVVLGVDLKGVCADFYMRMRKITAEWFERPLEDLTTAVSYGLSEWGIPNSAGGPTNVGLSYTDSQLRPEIYSNPYR